MADIIFDAAPSASAAASPGFWDGLQAKDLIGTALGIFSAREQAKVDSRMQASRDQATAYDQAMRSAAAAPQPALPSWLLPVAGLVVLGLGVYLVAK